MSKLQMPSISFLLAFALAQNPVPALHPDVSLAVACAASNEISLTILNKGEVDTAVFLGYALGNGARYYPREIVVEVKRTATAEFEELRFVGPAAIAGRIDHWIVTLPARATFTLPLLAGDFAGVAAGFRPLTASPDELRVRLTGRSITSDLNPDLAGIKAWRLWTGTATSNSLRFASECGR